MPLCNNTENSHKFIHYTLTQKITQIYVTLYKGDFILLKYYVCPSIIDDKPERSCQRSIYFNALLFLFPLLKRKSHYG